MKQEDVDYSWNEIRRLGDLVLQEQNENKFNKYNNNNNSNMLAATTNGSSAPATNNASQQQQQDQLPVHTQIVKLNGKMNLPAAMPRSASEISVVNLPRLNDLKTAYTNLLEAAGEDIRREGLVKTPERAAKAFQFFTAGYHQDLKGKHQHL